MSSAKFVQVSKPKTAGKNIKAFETVDGEGDTVYAQAVVLVDPDGDATPTQVVLTPATADLSNGHETAVSSSAVLILAANPSRKSAIVQNTGLANFRLGVAGVTPTTGSRVIPDATVILEGPTTRALWAIAEGELDSVAFAQEID